MDRSPLEWGAVEGFEMADRLTFPLKAGDMKNCKKLFTAFVKAEELS